MAQRPQGQGRESWQRYRAKKSQSQGGGVLLSAAECYSRTACGAEAPEIGQKAVAEACWGEDSEIEKATAELCNKAAHSMEISEIGQRVVWPNIKKGKADFP